jgi:uncharacterized protein YbjT (DUF2867 family)
LNPFFSPINEYMAKTALLAGATGLVGHELLNCLCNDPEYNKVIVLARRLIPLNNSKIEIQIIDFELINELNFLDKIDVCFCCLGTTQKKMGREGLLKVDLNYVLELGRLCERHHIGKFLVVSSQMANPRSASFYMRTKGLMEEQVSKLSVPVIYFLRPSLLVGKREDFRFAEKIGYYLYKAFQPIMIGKIRKMRAIKGSQVARAMIHLAGTHKTGCFIVESDVLASL